MSSATVANQVSRYQEIVDLEQRYLLQTYQRYPLAIARGKGVFVYDVDGRRYLDFVAGLGVNALGHAHPRIVKTIREQAARVIHTSNLYYNEYQGQLAQKLCQLSGLDQVFFTNSGTEAMEGALKLARAASSGTPGKCSVVALDGSFHGRTFGALSLTGQEKYRKSFEPLLEGVRFVRLNDVQDLRQAVDATTCAIVLEPIQGEGGIRECTREFMAEARSLADQHGAALIFDEIQCGLGRLGKLFAFQHYGVEPDVVTIAKPLAAGLPLGAFLTRKKLSGALSFGKHGTTFGGGPLACRVALEYFNVIEEEKLLENVERVGTYLRQQLEAIAKSFAIAKEVRGYGLMQALDLSVPSRPIVEAAQNEGVLVNSTQETAIRFLPPFLIKETHADKAMRVLRRLLKKTGKPKA
ncbi:MAG: aspartate aminotransferase family protein [Acidobacteriales bacterium]|nr:aspartate aminotransferase family protein [Terriglobales bacterium]